MTATGRVGFVEMIELSFGVVLTIASIIGIIRIGAAEEKSMLHIHLYTNAGCSAKPILLLHAIPQDDKIAGFIQTRPGEGEGCSELLLMSSSPISSASQGLGSEEPVQIDALKTTNPQVFGAWFSYQTAMPGRFVLDGIHMSSDQRNKLWINVGQFSLRDPAKWTKKVRAFVATAQLASSTRVKLGFLGEYEMSSEPKADSCTSIEDAGEGRPSEECYFDRPWQGDVLKIQADPTDLKATQDAWIAVLGLLASGGFGLVFDAIRRSVVKLAGGANNGLHHTSMRFRRGGRKSIERKR